VDLDKQTQTWCGCMQVVGSYQAFVAAQPLLLAVCDVPACGADPRHRLARWPCEAAWASSTCVPVHTLPAVILECLAGYGSGS
jgi:hypothetical protein